MSNAARKISPARLLNLKTAAANDTMLCRVSCEPIDLDGVKHHRVEVQYRGELRYRVDLPAAKYPSALARTAGVSWAEARELRVEDTAARRA